MRGRRRVLGAALCGGAALLCSCAYIGEPAPPSLGIPVKIIDLTATERAEILSIGFSVPAVTTNETPLRSISEVELRIGAPGPQWESESKRIDTNVTEPGPVHLDLPVAEWVGREVLVRVRAAGKHGRFGEWSNTVLMKVTPPFVRPDLRAEATAKGVRLTWAAEPVPDAEYRLFKRGPADQKPVVLATVKTPEYVDALAEFGKHYEYSVEAFLKSGDSEARSDPSETVPITPVDTFPPTVPAGVTAISGVSSIDLTWSPDPEPDLRGYYVYRAVGDGPFVKLGELVQTPAYSDHAFESGKRYRYAISAVDQTGNESARSAPVEAAAP
jgi:hypothetical protein